MTELFITILNMSLTASAVVLFVLLLRLLLRRAPKIYSYALWAMVLLRLLCPWTPESALSLLPVAAEAIPQEIVYSPAPAIASELPLLDQTVNAVLSQEALQPQTVASANPLQIVLAVASWLWLAGAVALLSYAIISYLRLRRRLSTATLLRDNIYRSDRITSPFVLGLVRPRIYLPLGLPAAEDDYILLHEQGHISRRDYLIKPLAFLALSLHWFNPLVWLSFHLMTKDMEMSCDERVLKRYGADIRSSYSGSLLALATKRSGLSMPLAFGESSARARVKNVLRYKKPLLWISIVAVLALAVAAICLLTDKPQPPEEATTPRQMGLEDVIALAAKGEALTADDFTPFDGQVVSEPNAEITRTRYLVERDFHLLISAAADGSLNTAMFCPVWNNPITNGLDIRSQDVELYLATNVAVTDYEHQAHNFITTSSDLTEIARTGIEKFFSVMAEEMVPPILRYSDFELHELSINQFGDSQRFVAYATCSYRQTVPADGGLGSYLVERQELEFDFQRQELDNSFDEQHYLLTEPLTMSREIEPGIPFYLEADTELLSGYGWQVTGFLGQQSITLPDSLMTTVEDGPEQLFWMRSLVLSQDIGLDFSAYLGQEVDVEIYSTPSRAPELYQNWPGSQSRLIMLRDEGQLIGAFICHGRHEGLSFALSMRDFEQITGSSLAEYWQANYYDASDPVNIAAEQRTPEQVIERYFTSLASKDNAAQFSSLSVEAKLAMLFVNLDDEAGLLYNQLPGAMGQFKTIEIKSIEFYPRDEGLPYDTYVISYDATVEPGNLTPHVDGPGGRYVDVANENGRYVVDGTATGM